MQASLLFKFQKADKPVCSSDSVRPISGKVQILYQILAWKWDCNRLRPEATRDRPSASRFAAYLIQMFRLYQRVLPLVPRVAAGQLDTAKLVIQIVNRQRHFCTCELPLLGIFKFDLRGRSDSKCSLWKQLFSKKHTCGRGLSVYQHYVYGSLAKVEVSLWFPKLATFSARLPAADDERCQLHTNLSGRKHAISTFVGQKPLLFAKANKTGFFPTQKGIREAIRGSVGERKTKYN